MYAATQIGEVLDSLLDLSEAVVVSAFSVLSADMPTPDKHATVRQVRVLTTALLLCDWELYA